MDGEDEIWKVYRHSKYLVSNNGRVKRTGFSKAGKYEEFICKQRLNNGVSLVSIIMDGRNTTLNTHRAVAELFGEPGVVPIPVDDTSSKEDFYPKPSKANGEKLVRRRFKTLTRERLLELVGYDIEKGELYWLEDRGTAKKSDPCGNKRLCGNGYYYMRVEGISAAVHRFVWLFHNGHYDADIDHINNDTLDNHIENLRLCTRSENLRNRGKFANCSSKYKGVYWKKDSKKWRASIRLDGRTINLGHFKTEEEAHLAWLEAASGNHGESLRRN